MWFSYALTLGLACLSSVGVDARPNGLTDGPPPPGGYKTVGYYVNWATYDRKFDPQDLEADQWTHVLYSFADIASSGEVNFADPFSNFDKIFDGDSLGLQGNNLHGALRDMYMMKKKNRHLKTLLSIGGWSYRMNFAGPASTPAGRSMFVQSSLKMLKNYGFDGIDIDWEYPANEKEASDFVLLLAELRKALDEYSTSIGDNYKYLLTVASPAGAQHYQIMKLGEMDKYLDFWNLMAYDYAGSWDKTSGHQANLFRSKSNPESTKFNSQDAIMAYMAAGIKAEKIILGMPLYGRAIQSMNRQAGSSASAWNNGTWEAGIYDYKKLPMPGSEVVTCMEEVASYSYDASTGLFISYDTPEIAKMKANFLRQQGMGGTMWWETSSDKPKNDGSLVETVIKQLGGREKMDMSMNQLNYPQSQYDNIKNNKQ